MSDATVFGFASEARESGGRGTSRTESVIDGESYFTGTYRTPRDLRIDGRYEGEIECGGTVFVGETATVKARIMAGNVTVAGSCEGEILCETRFEILRTGKVTGSVSTSVTVIHDGAFYQGDLRMTRGKDRPQGIAMPSSVSRPEPLIRPTPPPTERNAPARGATTPAERPQSAPPPPRRRPAESTPETPAEPESPDGLIASTAAGNGLRANGAIKSE